MKYKLEENFSQWYQEVVLGADLAEYGVVRGTMIFKPYGFALWKNVQKYLGEMINKDLSTDDVYFPLLIPLEFLQKEKEHVEGFAPEVAIVTKAGNKKLEKPLVIRPTSETIMYEAFSRWIESYKDLPLKVNQWVNIVRWEKRTVLFLRSSEFLWQEGHTVHQTDSEATEQVLAALNAYDYFLRAYMAIPAVKGYKTEGEKFSGAKYTMTLEALLKTKKALQIATSHHLGQNFAKAFNIKFLDKHNKEKYPWQTSWGFSTRALGGLIATHGDDKGLVLPPNMAPVKVVIIPIFKDGSAKVKVSEFVGDLEKMLDGVGISYKTDWSDNSPGWKFHEWELKGVPIRIEVGLNEVEANEIKCVARFDGSVKVFKRNSTVHKQIQSFLDDIQGQMLSRAQKFVNDNITTVSNEKELKEVLKEKGGFVKVFYKDTEKTATYLQEKYKITPRVIPLDTYNETGKDFMTGEDGAKITLFAKAY